MGQSAPDPKRSVENGDKLSPIRAERGRAVPDPLAALMNREQLKQLVARKRAASEPMTAEEAAKGFRGWYSSKFLPHFDSPGTCQAITYRMGDSVPVTKRAEWEAILATEEDAERRRRIESFLDSGYGACHLRDGRIARMVQDNLWHHDGHKYRLLAWNIMPNHVHVMIEQWQTPLADVVKSWKSYTSKAANKILGRTGPFWAEDYFDRHVRDETHYRKVISYIEMNPVKVRLSRTPEEWRWSSAPYRSTARQLVDYPQYTARELRHPTARRTDT